MRYYDKVRQQVERWRVKHPGAVLMVNLGDFYHLFAQDADIAIRVLQPDPRRIANAFGWKQVEVFYKEVGEARRKLEEAGYPVVVCCVRA